MFNVGQRWDTCAKTEEPMVSWYTHVIITSGGSSRSSLHLQKTLTPSQLCGWYLCRVFISFCKLKLHVWISFWLVEKIIKLALLFFKVLNLLFITPTYNFPCTNIATVYQIFIWLTYFFFALQGCRLWVHPRVYCIWSPLDWIISWLAYWSTKHWDCLCCWWTQLQSVSGENNRQQTRWCGKPVSFWRY